MSDHVSETESQWAESNAVVRALLLALDAYLPGAAARGEHVSVLTVGTLERLGASDEELAVARQAGALHDIGKLSVRREVLLKPAPLTAKELTEVREHVRYGSRLLERIPQLASAAPLVLRQYEHWAGTGFPDGLKGADIALGARALSVSLAFVAMTTSQPWRQALSEDEALEQIRSDAGRAFDPQVVEAFLAVQPLIQPVAL
jgi:response regulator RpfG family c-di-GMP phosphodiesterase